VLPQRKRVKPRSVTGSERRRVRVHPEIEFARRSRSNLEREPTLDDLGVPESKAGSVSGSSAPISDNGITKKIAKASPSPENPNASSRLCDDAPEQRCRSGQ
jgi:hypothetical protein